MDESIGKRKKREYESFEHQWAVVSAARWRGCWIHWKSGKWLGDKKRRVYETYWQSRTDRLRRIAENAEIAYLCSKSAPMLEQYKREGLIGRKRKAALA